MDKLNAYMDRLGIEHSDTEFGAAYFYNAPAIRFSGAYITLRAGEINTAAWKQLHRYCTRWGYSIRPWKGTPGETVFAVCRASDREALDTYTAYSEKSFDACTKATHLRREGLFSDMSDAEFNDYLKGIMDFWGSEYMEAIA